MRRGHGESAAPARVYTLTPLPRTPAASYTRLRMSEQMSSSSSVMLKRARSGVKLIMVQLSVGLHAVITGLLIFDMLALNTCAHAPSHLAHAAAVSERASAAAADEEGVSLMPSTCDICGRSRRAHLTIALLAMAVACLHHELCREDVGELGTEAVATARHLRPTQRSVTFGMRWRGSV